MKSRFVASGSSWRGPAGRRGHRAAADEYRDRHGRHRRRLLSDGRRHGKCAVEASARRAGTARVTGGSVDNLKLIGSEQSRSPSRWSTQPSTL